MSPQFPPRTHRARTILEAVGRAYPEAWTGADHFRGLRGHGDVPQWPDWCYLPLHAAYAIVSGAHRSDQVPLAVSHHIGIVGALAAWRMGQVIIRFDPALYEPMISTRVAGDLPTELLYRLPCWCVYIETPGLVWDGAALYGFWAHLDWSEGAPAELRLVLDVAADPGQPLAPASCLVPVPIILGAGTIADALARVIASGQRQAAAHGLSLPTPGGGAVAVTLDLEPMLSLILYLCSDQPDWPSRGAPGNPEPIRTRRHGWRLFPADAPTTWDVGVRMGAALRRAYQAEQTGQAASADDSHAGPRGHVRRAHWHGFRSGPRLREDGSEIPADQRRLDVRWLPPIPVNLGDVDALPATIRRVE